MNIDIIDILKEKNIVENFDKTNERELLILFKSIGELKKIDNKYYFNNEICEINISKNKKKTELFIGIDTSRSIKIILQYYDFEIEIKQNNNSIQNNTFIKVISNKYFRYSKEKRILESECSEYKGLEVKRDCQFGTNIKYFKEIGKNIIEKTENDQENELPISLVGISKTNEIDEKLLFNKKLVLFND